MITARIHRDQDDDDGVLVHLMTIPRLNESISIPDDDGVERDLRITGINHWVKPIGGHLQQVEVALFCQPAYTQPSNHASTRRTKRHFDQP